MCAMFLNKCFFYCLADVCVVGRTHKRVVPGACLGSNTLSAILASKNSSGRNVPVVDRQQTLPTGIPTVVTFRSEFEQLLARANVASVCGNVASEGRNVFRDNFLIVQADVARSEFWWVSVGF